MALRLSSKWHSWFFLIFAYMDIYMHLMGVLLPTQLHWDLCVYPSHLQEYKATAAYQYCQPAVKTEKARGTMKQETKASGTGITEMFMKRKQEQEKRPQLEKHPAPEANKPTAKRAKATSPDPTEKVMAVLNTSSYEYVV